MKSKPEKGDDKKEETEPNGPIDLLSSLIIIIIIICFFFSWTWWWWWWWWPAAVTSWTPSPLPILIFHPFPSLRPSLKTSSCSCVMVSAILWFDLFILLSLLRCRSHRKVAISVFCHERVEIVHYVFLLE